MDTYPYKFTPIYKEKIWGGRNLERLFARALPAGEQIGESWELADLVEGTSVVSNGPRAGTPLTELTAALGPRLLGTARPLDNGRFPLLLKFLDANDILSLQVHPDAQAAAEIGGDAAPKTECWYVVESRGGFIYKGVRPGVRRRQFRRAIENDTVGQLVRRVDCASGDFHFLPAGTVHALGPGLVVAEVQTPSDTTYRVTDWGRGREIHVDRSMQCIHFDVAADASPGASGRTLLVTDFFTVALREAAEGQSAALPPGRCAALMMVRAGRHSNILKNVGMTPAALVRHGGPVETPVPLAAGDTVLLPAELRNPTLEAAAPCRWLEITLPDTRGTAD